MILFVGSKEKGYFSEDVAKKAGLVTVYIQENIHISKQAEDILVYKEKCRHIIYQIDQYADSTDEIVKWILKIQDALNVKSIIYAVGYPVKSQIIMELWKSGIKNYVFSSFLADQKEDLELCLNNYYETFGYEEKRGITFEFDEEVKAEEQHFTSAKTIGIAGAVPRMGTTTHALQFIKHLSFMGYRAAYIQMNSHHYVEDLAESYADAKKDEEIGLVTYQQVDMYYRLDKLQDVRKREYDFFVYDYGYYNEPGFNKVSFLERDVQVFVVGSKPGEFDRTYDVIMNNFYNNVFYIFNFVAEAEKKDLIELMEDKADCTFFADDIRDPFTYSASNIYGDMLPVENKNQELTQKRKFVFGRRKK